MVNLSEYIFSLGADLVGFADLTAFPAENRLNLPYGIAIAAAVNPQTASDISDTVSIEYFNEYEALTSKLDKICLAVAKYITNLGYTAVAQTVRFARNQRDMTETSERPGYALMPHKTVAAVSGLGWIGKSTLLITEKYGSAVRLTSVLTDMPLPAEPHEYECLCGDCNICSEACPGKVIKNRKWTADTWRDDLIDFNACRKAVKERGRALNIDHGTCGICMAVCPYTQRYINGYNADGTLPIYL